MTTLNSVLALDVKLTIWSSDYTQEKTATVVVFIGRRDCDKALVPPESISTDQECSIEQDVTWQAIDEVECLIIDFVRELQFDVLDASASHRLTTPRHLKAKPCRRAGVNIFPDSVGEVGRHGGNIGRQVRKDDRFAIFASALETQMATTLEMDPQIGRLAGLKPYPIAVDRQCTGLPKVCTANNSRVVAIASRNDVESNHAVAFLAP
jgi:hypothetical protein